MGLLWLCKTRQRRHSPAALSATVGTDYLVTSIDPQPGSVWVLSPPGQRLSPGRPVRSRDRLERRTGYWLWLGSAEDNTDQEEVVREVPYKVSPGEQSSDTKKSENYWVWHERYVRLSRKLSKQLLLHSTCKWGDTSERGWIRLKGWCSPEQEGERTTLLMGSHGGWSTWGRQQESRPALVGTASSWIFISCMWLYHQA